MKTVGLVTEYNPFHNGHKYHIEKAKELTGADTVIVVMSGNYVQRGTPAIMPKHLRTEVALKAGASIVIELPVCYATGSAEYFATGAISLLDRLQCVDAICFGSECGNLDDLTRLAHILLEEPPIYKSLLQAHMKNGLSFPLARQKALKEYLKEDELSTVLEFPNNILGIEYIKALIQRKSSIVPCTIKRKVSGYHDDTLAENYSSASAIRRLLAFSGNALELHTNNFSDEPELSDLLSKLEGQVPAACIKTLEDTRCIRYPVYSNDFSLLLKQKLLSETKESLQNYFDISEDLANRMMNHRNDFISFDQFCDLVKTRDITYARISRCLIHILLNLKSSDLRLYKDFDYHKYIHVLGFAQKDAALLSAIASASSLLLLTKLTDTQKLSPEGVKMLNQDIFAADLYESVITDKFAYPFISEYEQQIIKN